MMASAGNVPGRIFISYRRAETAWAAGRLFDRLADHFGKDQVFTDVESIEPGDDFVEMIAAAVGSCDVLLALIGDQWLTITDQDGQPRLDDPHDYVRLEIEAALERNIRVIPILVEGARMPPVGQLPTSLAKLARIQALELSPAWFGRDTHRLIRVLDLIIDQAQQQTRQEAERQRAVELLQQKMREQAVARDWDAVVAANDELAGLDLTATDPDGLASMAREQITRRQQTEEAGRAAGGAQYRVDGPLLGPDGLLRAALDAPGVIPTGQPEAGQVTELAPAARRVGYVAPSKKARRRPRLRRYGHSIRRRPANLVIAAGITVAGVTAISLIIANSVISDTPPPGTVRWSYTTGDAIEYGAAVANGSVYVGSDDDKLYALDAATGHFRWSYTTGAAVDSVPAVANGSIYVGSDDDKLYALDAATGHFRWSYTTGDPVDSGPAVADGTVYVGSRDNKVYALDAATGHLRWSYTTGGIIDSGLTVADGTVYVGNWDSKVYALDAATGHLHWSYDTGDRVSSGLAVANGTVYLGSYDNKVYALDAATGHLRWSYTTGGPVDSGPAVASGIVYVGSLDHKVYALDAATGHLRWSFTTGNWVAFESGLTVVGGTVYVGSLDHKVYALDAATGRRRWSYTTNDEIYAGPAVVGGTVYIGSNDHKMYALSASS
jgi:outer membrane protein assembly factor BamB